MWSEGQWEASKKTALDGTYRQTDRMTDGHGDSKTNSAKRAELVKIGVIVKESDHNVLLTEFNCKIRDVAEKSRSEIYNLKNKHSQAKFKEYISKDNSLSSIFDSADNLDKLVERFIKKS